MQKFFALLCVSVSSLVSVSMMAQVGVPVGAPVRPLPAVEHVLIISVDGLRSDRALLADMPVLRSLLKRGAYTFWARTTPSAITLPSHTSMLTGVTTKKHGVEWNRDLPFSQEVYPNVPTVFEMATGAGYTTALIAGKSKFSALNKPGTVTYGVVPKAGIPKGERLTNAEVTEEAAKIIEAHKPGLIFVHYPDVDGVGHARGWGSPEQLAMIESTDAELGKLFEALKRAQMMENTMVILSSDHGGAGLGHGPDDARSRHIPWIIAGPGVRRGYDLTQLDKLEVNTEDTAVTACWLLGLRIQPYFDGKPVLAVFEQIP